MLCAQRRYQGRRAHLLPRQLPPVPEISNAEEKIYAAGSSAGPSELIPSADPSMTRGETSSRSGSVGILKEDEEMMDLPLNRSFRSPLSSTRTKTPSDGNEDQLEHSPYQFADEMFASDVFIPGISLATSASDIRRIVTGPFAH